MAANTETIISNDQNTTTTIIFCILVWVFCFNFHFLLWECQFEFERTCSHLYSMCAVKWKTNYVSAVEWFIESLWRARFNFASQLFFFFFFFSCYPVSLCFMLFSQYFGIFLNFIFIFQCKSKTKYIAHIWFQWTCTSIFSTDAEKEYEEKPEKRVTNWNELFVDFGKMNIIPLASERKRKR